jgi:hypothetical protein
MTFSGATREPMEEFKKLTASLLTPTIKSKTAKDARMINAMKNRSIGPS